MVAHQKADAGGLQVQGKPGLQIKLSLKKKALNIPYCLVRGIVQTCSPILSVW